MISAFSLHIPKWVAAPLRTLTRTFPSLNAASWDLQYQLGLWNYLDSEQAGHGLLQVMQKYAPQASILDLGCGASANLPLAPGTYKKYHGIDISAQAIERARAMGRADCSYETADILTYVPREAYDAIIISEVLCYLPIAKISGFLHRLSGYLTPTGVILIQIWAGAMDASVTAAIEGSGLPMAQEENAEPDAGRPRKIAELDGGRPRTIYILHAPVSAGGSEGTA